MRETRVRSLGREDPLEKEVVTHSSILAWRIPWMEKPGRLQSMGSQRVGHDWVTFTLLYLLLKIATLQDSINTHTMLSETPLLHQSFGPCVFSLSPSLSFSLSLRLILWSTEALWVHFPARASQTLWWRCTVPSPPKEGTWGLREQSKLLKEISPEYSLEGLMLKLKYFGHLMWRTDSLEKTVMLEKIEDRRRKGWQRMRWLNGITHAMDMSLSRL